jgi:hypothetical protein
MRSSNGNDKVIVEGCADERCLTMVDMWIDG